MKEQTMIASINPNQFEQRNLHTEELFVKYYSDRDWNKYRHLLAQVVQYAPPGKILDLGCGLGFFVECATCFGFDVEGIEGSKYAVQICKTKNLKVKKQLLSDPLPYANKTISTIILNQVIEHLPNDVAKFVLQEAFRVLEKNGIVIIKSPCKFDPIQAREETHINLYAPSELFKEVEVAGFTVINKQNTCRNFGLGRVGRIGTILLSKIVSWDMLYKSANCIAIKR